MHKRSKSDPGLKISSFAQYKPERNRKIALDDYNLDMLSSLPTGSFTDIIPADDVLNTERHAVTIKLKAETERRNVDGSVFAIGVILDVRLEGDSETKKTTDKEVMVTEFTPTEAVFPATDDIPISEITSRENSSVFHRNIDIDPEMNHKTRDEMDHAGTSAKTSNTEKVDQDMTDISYEKVIKPVKETTFDVTEQSHTQATIDTTVNYFIKADPQISNANRISAKEPQQETCTNVKFAFCEITENERTPVLSNERPGTDSDRQVTPRVGLTENGSVVTSETDGRGERYTFFDIPVQKFSKVTEGSNEKFEKETKQVTAIGKSKCGEILGTSSINLHAGAIVENKRIENTINKHSDTKSALREVSRDKTTKNNIASQKKTEKLRGRWVHKNPRARWKDVAKIQSLVDRTKTAYELSPAIRKIIRLRNIKVPPKVSSMKKANQKRINNDHAILKQKDLFTKTILQHFNSRPAFDEVKMSLKPKDLIASEVVNLNDRGENESTSTRYIDLKLIRRNKPINEIFGKSHSVQQQPQSPEVSAINDNKNNNKIKCKVKQNAGLFMPKETLAKRNDAEAKIRNHYVFGTQKFTSAGREKLQLRYCKPFMQHERTEKSRLQENKEMALKLIEDYSTCGCCTCWGDLLQTVTTHKIPLRKRWSKIPLESKLYPHPIEIVDHYGIVLLISNTHFEIKDGTNINRVGGENCEERVKNVFEDLGYCVHQYPDCPAKQIEDLIAFYSHTDSFLRKPDSLHIVVLSHGSLGYVNGVDNKEFSVQGMINYLECEESSLQDIQKVLYILTCQGYDELPTRPRKQFCTRVQDRDCLAVNTEVRAPEQNYSSTNLEVAQVESILEDCGEKTYTYTEQAKPTKPNLTVFYGASRGELSIRSYDWGSIVVAVLCRNLKFHSWKGHGETLNLTETLFKTREETQEITGFFKQQSPEILYTQYNGDYYLGIGRVKSVELSSKKCTKPELGLGYPTRSM